MPKRFRKKVKLIGPIISTKPVNLPDVRDIRKDFGFESKKPLIYAAISGPGKERFFLIEKLSTILQILPNHYQIILTKGSPGSKSKSIKKKHVIFYNWIDEVEQSMLLKASDTIISRAGHGIITKSLAYGKPLILIPIPNQTEQYGNAFRAKELGVAEVIEQQELNEINLEQSIDNVINSDFYNNAKKFSKVASVNDGVGFATDLIIEVANSTKK
jgi:UDP:flavonoid glycosyltransferase YjiC (YdhE family)